MNNAIKYLIEELVRIYKVDVSIFDYDYMCSINSYDELEKYLSKLISDYNLRNFINEMCDYTRGIEILKCLINMGSIEAINRLGVAYYFGKGVPLDYQEAIKWYTIAANQGNTTAQNNLASMYYKGKGVEQNYEKALRWFTEAANQGNTTAQNNLASMYYKGKGVEQNYEKAFRWFTEAANQGNTTAQNNLASMYYLGKGVTQDYQEAFKWFTEAASKGNRTSKYYLGLMCYEGQGVTQDYQEAFKWFTEAANEGDVDAKFMLGSMCFGGIGIPQDYQEAFKWFTEAANEEIEEAIFHIGLMNYFGLGIPKDINKGYKLLKKSSYLGSPHATLFLKMLNNQDLGKETEFINSVLKIAENNYGITIDYIIKHAEQGSAIFQASLGFIYKNGIDVEKNFYAALKYYKMALDNGYEIIREEYEKLLKEVEELNQSRHLHFGERKDVFVSWSHFNQNIKNTLCEELESRNLFTVWESDTNGIGGIDDVIKGAILQSRSYLIILTGNSIYSEWVEKELNIIFEKVGNSKEYEYTIRPIVFNIKVIDGKEEYFDVIKAINGFDKNSPFKKLLDYCFHFDNGDLDYDKLANLLKEGISKSLKIEYRDKVLNDTQRYNAAINNVIKDDSTKSGIIATTFSFEEGYLNRPLYDNYNNRITTDEIFINNKNVLIYGERGIGKSLYLKNYLRTKFNGDRYLFYLPCKEMNNHLDKDISDIIREVCFDKYFSIDERKLLTPNAFEQIFQSDNKIILLVDALDEIPIELRKKLIDKLNSLHLRYKNIFTLFTTRNKSDSQIIEDKFYQGIEVYELKNLTKEDIEKIYNVFNDKAKFKKDDNKLTINKISKEEFFISLDKVSDKIKTNPLLLSNLILIYFVKKKVMKTTYDVIRETVDIMIKEINLEEGLFFKYKDEINENILIELLGYFSLQLVNNNKNEYGKIIYEYFKKKYEQSKDWLEKDYSKIAAEVYKYLRRRAIINEKDGMHSIYSNYFVAVYLYNKIYKNKTNYYGFPYIDYKVENEFNTFCKLYFTNEDEPWPNISTDLVYKLDYEIYRINDRAEMNEEHFSYDVFHKTLTKIQDDGFSKAAIKIIEEVIKKDAFHFNEFIKKYFYK